VKIKGAILIISDLKYYEIFISACFFIYPQNECDIIFFVLPELGDLLRYQVL
jgi:hypothetical protein